MKQLTIDMPVVTECMIDECAYNVLNQCHARAITIGDGIHPGCDTVLMVDNHTKETKRQAGVGACKVAMCKFNDDYECVADSISVGHVGNNIECMTFASA